MKIGPDMLVSYEMPDKTGLTVLMKLRPGIKTHPKPPMNGRIFTAKDVAYSIMRKAGKIDPKAATKYARIAQYDGLEKAEAVDDVTVKLTLSKPNAVGPHSGSEPRCHFPAWYVVYPTVCNADASVTVLSGIARRLLGDSACGPNRPGYRPLIRAVRVGVQTGCT